ncbi:MAG: ribose-phosphate pyrophosphokinase [Desulfobacterales bacterium]|nr:ribose-phosphate pyrophosphokinase [Desulfobacterales bacterium]
MIDLSGIVVFSGNSNLELAKKICSYLNVPLGEANIKRFSDGEIQVEIKDRIRSKDVFLIQSTCAPVNDNLMELFLMLDAFKRSSAHRIITVIPYYGYARQDRKVIPHVPISAKLVADLVTTAGTQRVITMDLHAGQIQGFFNIPVDNLFAAPVLLKYIKENFNQEEVVIVSPDAGGVERARAFAKRLMMDLAIIDKRRISPNQAKAMGVVGNVKDKIAIILDDMVDTAGSLVEAAGALKKNGAKELHACCTHAVLSGQAIDRLNNSDINTLIVTDTIPIGSKQDMCKKIKVLSISEIVGAAIFRCHIGASVSSLFV